MQQSNLARQRESFLLELHLLSIDSTRFFLQPPRNFFSRALLCPRVVQSLLTHINIKSAQTTFIALDASD